MFIENHDLGTTVNKVQAFPGGNWVQLSGEREGFLVKIIICICFRIGFLNKVQAFPGGNQLSQRVFESHLFLSPPHLEEFAEIYII